MEALVLTVITPIPAYVMPVSLDLIVSQSFDHQTIVPAIHVQMEVSVLIWTMVFIVNVYPATRAPTVL